MAVKAFLFLQEIVVLANRSPYEVSVGFYRDPALKILFCSRCEMIPFMLPYLNVGREESNMMPQISENVTWKNLGSSVVLLNLVDSSYYVLNETASLAFRAVLDGKTSQQIAASFAGEYDCSADQASADVAETLDYLTKEGLLKAA
jgi:hypothetical protein